MKTRSTAVLATSLAWVLSGTALADVTILTGPIEYNGHQYYLLDTSTWAAAEAEAVLLGGHLATVNDRGEQDWIYSTFNAYDAVNRLYWIGLNDMAVEGHFVWASGEPVTFTHWAPGEPNNAWDCENYVAMYYLGHTHGGFWNDWYDRTHDPIGISFSGVVEVIPEPAAIWLLALGAFAMVRRRRR